MYGSPTGLFIYLSILASEIYNVTWRRICICNYFCILLKNKYIQRFNDDFFPYESTSILKYMTRKREATEKKTPTFCYFKLFRGSSSPNFALSKFTKLNLDYISIGIAIFYLIYLSSLQYNFSSFYFVLKKKHCY